MPNGGGFHIDWHDLRREAQAELRVELDREPTHAEAWARAKTLRARQRRRWDKHVMTRYAAMLEGTGRPSYVVTQLHEEAAADLRTELGREPDFDEVSKRRDLIIEALWRVYHRMSEARAKKKYADMMLTAVTLRDDET